MIADMKSKIIVPCWHFFADMTFSAISKVRTIEIKPEKIPYTQTIHA